MFRKYPDTREAGRFVAVLHCNIPSYKSIGRGVLGPILATLVGGKKLRAQPIGISYADGFRYLPDGPARRMLLGGISV